MFADGEWIVPMQGLPGQGAAYPSVTARPCGFLSGVDRNCRQENSHTDIHQVHRLTVHPQSIFNVLNMLKCLYLLCIACDFKAYLTRPTIEKFISKISNWHKIEL